jgi:hypothetical protein
MKKLLLILIPFLLLAQPRARVQRTVVCTGAGSATVATCAPSPVLTALSDLSTTPRTLVSFTPTANNTGALTLAINGLAATSVVKYVGGAAQALAANDLRSGTSYMLEYDGLAFVVKSVLGNGGGGGGGTGDVVGPASAADNEVAIYDSTTGKLIKRGTGCTIASATLTCTGGFESGDGTVQGLIRLKELAANGANDFRIYGAADQAIDGCLVFSGPLASGDSWRGSASTVTIDGKTCRVMETYTPGAGGGAVYRDSWSCYRDGNLSLGCNFRANTAASPAYNVLVAGSSSAGHLVGLTTTAVTGPVAGVSFRMPVAPTTWTFTVEIHSAGASAPTLELTKTCIAPGSASSTSYAGAQTATVSPAAAGRYHSYSFAVTPGSCAAGDFVQIQISQTTAVATNIIAMSQVIQ